MHIISNIIYVGSSCSAKIRNMWTEYHQYDTILRFMNCLRDNNPDKVKIYDIGQSSEGRW